MQTSATLSTSLSLNRRLLHTLLFYMGWVVCLKSAALQAPWLGSIVGSSILVFHFWQSTSRWADLLSLLAVMAVGPLSDMLYLKLKLLEYTNASPQLEYMPPIWVFLLWALFGINLHLFAWMHGKRKWAILFGGIGGPISYLSAVRLGGAILLQPLPWTLFVIGLCWVILLPFFLACNQAARSHWPSS